MTTQDALTTGISGTTRTTARAVNPFLADPSFGPLWRAVAAALDRNGLGWRGRLMLPELAPEGRRRLGVLLDRPIPVERRSVPLDAVATAVGRLTGADLVDLLAAVGCAPKGRHEAAQSRRDAAHRRQETLDASVRERLGTADWVGRWREAARLSGLFAQCSPENIAALVAGVAAVLAETGSGRSRTEVAAQVCGDAHALDSSARLTALVTRALVARDGEAGERAAWERARMPLDLVSAPVLTWGLPLLGNAGGAVAARALTAAGLPLHLSALAVRETPVELGDPAPILVVENPRLVEAAAQRRLPAAVICTNGNPTTAPSELIARLRAAGAPLRYHGDFDAYGLAMTARAHTVGCTPFQMSVGDYLGAVRAAAVSGVDLPSDPAPAPVTPWDPALAAAFDTHRAVVHEERVMDAVLIAHAER